MKKKTKKIFLPKWQRYFIVPFFIGIWSFVTYMEFFGAEQGEMGKLGYALMTLIFLGVSIMLWLMSSGRLPAYTMEEEVSDNTHNETSHEEKY